jgi:N-acyl-D-amino-acid deacylase
VLKSLSNEHVVLRGGLVVDGTGAPGRLADVEVIGGRIGSIGAVPAGLGRDLDVSGLAVCPGFIDVHTHLDAQVLWDPDLTPSSWHGVTTVVMGNCGFGIAPTREGDRERIARILENVEGMSFDALAAGIRWTFETFPEYLDALDRLPKRLNLTAMVGHTPVRAWVMGEACDDRAATSDEVARMAEIVEDALLAGAIGFSSSRAASHVGYQGRPVPSRFADDDELDALCRAADRAGRGVVQLTAGPGLTTPAELSDLAVRHNIPVVYAGLLTGVEPAGAVVARAAEQHGLPGEVWPQTACRPITMQMTMLDPFPFVAIDEFREIVRLPPSDRATRYRDAGWRERARQGVDRTERVRARLARTSLSESENRPDLIGRSVTELAGEEGRHPLDVLVDIALADELGARFTIVLANHDEEELAELLNQDNVLLGLSDAGAHASQLCDACYTTYLLEHWVRERKALSFETAIWRLTGHPADVFRVPERGRIQPGLVADLVVLDPERVGPLEARRVFDLPGGADRLIVGSRGIEHVFVAGTPIRVNGGDVGESRPGRLIRSAPR